MTEEIARIVKGLTKAGELSTSELAHRVGVTPATLRKWKKRGDLPSAPKGRSGQGRSVECMWSPKAQDEVIARANEARGPGPRS